jgi:transcriptional regulator with XRE-family HTH domain
MSRRTAPLLPATSELLSQFGERLRLARLRRRLSAKQVAERAGMNPMTLRSLERGGSGVTIGAYLAVMQVLGIEKELEQLAQADPLGRSLQDIRLTHRDSDHALGLSDAIEAARAAVPRRSQGRSSSRDPLATWDAPGPSRAVKKPRPAAGAREGLSKGGFIDSRELARLIDVLATRPRRTKAVSSRPKRR